MTFLLVFVLCIVVDWLYVGWNRSSLHKSQAVKAAMYSGALATVAVTTNLLYNANSWLIIPVIGGHAIGSFTAVKWATPEVKEEG